MFGEQDAPKKVREAVSALNYALSSAAEMGWIVELEADHYVVGSTMSNPRGGVQATVKVVDIYKKVRPEK